MAPTSIWPLVSRPRLDDARTSGFRPGTDLPPLATAIHRPRIDRDRAGPDLDDRPPLLFSMSPNRATASGKSNFSGLSPVGAPGRVADGRFRRAQPPQFAHGCAPTGEHLRGYFLVERNSFRFSRLLADLHHLGDRQELIYLPLGDSRFDSDVVLGQSLRSFQSSLNFFHLFRRPAGRDLPGIELPHLCDMIRACSHSCRCLYTGKENRHGRVHRVL